jgi:hypothetical protein
MVEVTLVSVANKFSTFGRFVARKRANLEQLGITTNAFIKGFLKDNMGDLETVLNNADIIEFINSDSIMSNKDFQSINYLLGEVGYRVLVSFVADDEINSLTVPSGVTEYNIIDESFIQNDLPTVTKINRNPGDSISEVLDSVVTQSGLFSPNTIPGVKNPLTILINNLKSEEKERGTISTTISGQLYLDLEYMGIKIFIILGEA